MNKKKVFKLVGVLVAIDLADMLAKAQLSNAIKRAVPESEETLEEGFKTTPRGKLILKMERLFDLGNEE